MMLSMLDRVVRVDVEREEIGTELSVRRDRHARKIGHTAAVHEDIRPGDRDLA